MRFERDLCLNLTAALGRHWLETDGRGAYASSTVLAVPTSRFHGLLVAPSQEQPERHVFVSRCEETFRGDGREFPISDAQFPGSLHPGGHRFLNAFDLDPTAADPNPRYTYRIGHVVVTREIRMLRDRPVTLVRYTATGQRKPIQLGLRPFLPCRRADALTWVNDSVDEGVRSVERGIVSRPYEALPEVALTISRQAAFARSPKWVRGIEYADDLARGYDGHEDLWSPGEWSVPLESGEDVVLALTIGEPVGDPGGAWRAAAQLAEPAGNAEGVRATLEAACDHYLYRDRDGRPGVIAGFPWFGEWGRDSLIALPGLTLARGEIKACGDVLTGMLPWLRDGRLPNVFGPTPEASDYNKAVDPAMWFGRAVRLYADAGGDESRVRDVLLPALLEIGEAHRGARGDTLMCDGDGLLFAGSADVAATWMDAVVDNRPVTPRNGAQVEVNALWYVLADTLANLLEGSPAAEWSGFRDRLGEAFLRRFWLERRNRLADVLTTTGEDDSVRPNMVIAAALEPSPLSAEQRATVADLARAELLTPFGLRTLSPRYLHYRGRFEGDQVARDDAYHQGTVWPWLLGFFVEAELRGLGRSPELVTRLRGLLDGFATHLGEHGLGHVSEVFDGDPPHRPGGCFAQAWSVAEIVRAYSLLDADTGLLDVDETGSGAA